MGDLWLLCLKIQPSWSVWTTIILYTALLAGHHYLTCTCQWWVPVNGWTFLLLRWACRFSALHCEPYCHCSTLITCSGSGLGMMVGHNLCVRYTCHMQENMTYFHATEAHWVTLSLPDWWAWFLLSLGSTTEGYVYLWHTHVPHSMWYALNA